MTHGLLIALEQLELPRIQSTTYIYHGSLKRYILKHVDALELTLENDGDVALELIGQCPNSDEHGCSVFTISGTNEETCLIAAAEWLYAKGN